MLVLRANGYGQGRENFRGYLPYCRKYPGIDTSSGTPTDVKESCRRLIKICSEGGGYILAGGASMNEGNPDNPRAIMAAAREYGTYK